MSRGKKLTVDAASIAEDYKNGMGVMPICEKYKVGKLRVKQILADAGLEMKKRGGQDKGSHTNSVKTLNADERYPEVEGYHYIAVLRTDTSVKTRDFKNKAGILTSIIKERFHEESTLWERKKYFTETGMQWWEQWFDIKSEPDEDVKKCPYCSWTTKDTTNASGAFEVHLREVHKMSKNEYLCEHPEDRTYFSLKNPSLNRHMETNPDKYVECLVCGVKYARIGTHLKNKHGMSIAEYLAKFQNAAITSHEFHEEQSVRTSIQNEDMKHSFESKAEKEIKEFIQSFGLECDADRKVLNGKEIDIFIPSLKIGFEYDGLIYHSEFGGGKSMSYHLDKTKTAEAKGVKLYHIFEDEYEHHKDIVLNKIQHIIRQSANLPKIMARKCVIKEVSREDANSFLEKFHIQSYANTSILRYGAFYEDSLIAVMTFFYNNGEWNLDRFASDYNFTIQGIGGKLFSHFIREKQPEKVISFADRRWTSLIGDNLYVKLGFSLDKVGTPDYSYIAKTNKERIHKFNFRKEILLKKYPSVLNEDMTESEMARKLGYDRIWNCGLLKYVWKS